MGSVGSKVFRLHARCNKGVCHMFFVFSRNRVMMLFGNFRGGARGAPAIRVRGTVGVGRRCCTQGRRSVDKL